MAVSSSMYPPSYVWQYQFLIALTLCCAICWVCCIVSSIFLLWLFLCLQFIFVFFALLTSCSPLVRALVCQPSGPESIPGMSHSETDITRGNLIMLLPPTTFLCTTCLCFLCHSFSWFFLARVSVLVLTNC